MNTFLLLLMLIFSAQVDALPTPPQLKQQVPAPPVVLPDKIERSTTEVAAPVQVPNMVSGILEVPKRNNVVLAATERAVLMELKTAKRDSNGSPVLDADGSPVMVPLSEGMYVFKDQVLGKFDDRELQSQLEISVCQLAVAKAEFEKEIEIKYAESGVKVSEAEYKMLYEANRMHSGAITVAELLKAALASEQAKANLELQEYTIKEVKSREVTVREKEIEAKSILIELRKLISPIDGMIVRIGKAEGEWLREGDEVLEIMQLKTLRARCKASALHLTPSMVAGKPVTVSMPMVNGKIEEFPGKVVFAHPVVEAGNRFEVLIEVENRPVGNSWALLPGWGVTAVIHL